jgi:hypothetical protein
MNASATNVFLVWLPTDKTNLHAAMPQHINRLDAFHRKLFGGRLNEFAPFRRAKVKNCLSPSGNISSAS